MAEWTEEDEKQLQELKAQVREMAGGSGAQADPMVQDIVPASTAFKLGFSDDGTAEKELSARGFTSSKRNKYGQLIAKDPNGNWVTDDNNWLLNGPRHIPQVAGVVASMFPTGRIAQVAAGGLAAGGTSAVKDAAAKLLGLNTKTPVEIAGGAALEAGENAFGTATGLAMGRIPLPKFTGVQNLEQLGAEAARRLLVQFPKKVTAKASGLLSGAGTKSTERLIERPQEVTDALEPSSVATLAKNAKEELHETMAAEGKLSKQGREAFRNRHGETPVDTEKMITGTPEDPGVLPMLDAHAPNEEGLGPMSVPEIKSLRRLVEKALMAPKQPASYQVVRTPEATQLGLPLQGRVSRPMKTGTPGSIRAQEIQPTLGMTERQVSPIDMQVPVGDTHIQHPLETLGSKAIPAQPDLFGGTMTSRISPAPHEVPRMANSHPELQLTQRMDFSKFGGTPLKPGSLGLSAETGKTTSEELLQGMSKVSPEEFIEMANQGRLHQVSGVDYPGESEALSPVSLGLINGYSPEDIAHFYVSRRGGRADIGYEEFIEDLSREIAHNASSRGTPARYSIPGSQMGLPILEQRAGGPIASEEVTSKVLPADQLGLPLERQRSFPIESGAPAPGFTEVQYGLPLPAPSRTQKSAGSLLKTADWLDAQILKHSKNAHGQTLPQDQLPKKVQIWKAMRKKIKDALHEVDAEYAASDARFTGKARHAELLDPLTNAPSSESFVKSLASRDQREMAREAAKDLLPVSKEGVEDMAAALDFHGPSKLSGWITPKRALTLAGLGIGGAGAYASQSDPVTSASILGIAAGLTSPRLHMGLLGTGSRVLGSPWSVLGQKMNPVSDAVARSLLYRGPWQMGLGYGKTLLPEEEK